MHEGTLGESSTSEEAEAEVSNREVAPVEKLSAKDKSKGSYVCPLSVLYVYIVVVMVNFDSNLTKCINKLDIMYSQSRLP